MVDEIAEMLLKESGLGTLSPMLMQFMPVLKALGLDQLTGTSGSTFRASDFLGNASAARLLQRKVNQRQFSGMYGEVLEEAETAFGNRAAQGIFRAMGYSKANAAVAAGGNLGRFIASVAEWRSPTASGTRQIAETLYGRKHMFRVSPGSEMESAVSQAHSGRRIIQGLTDAYNNNEFGRLSFDDVAGLASRIIQTGIADNASADGGADNRLAHIKSRMKNYSESLDKLKDVIDADMSKILDSMDKLFGGTTIAMSNAKLDKITTAMRHTALITGTDAKSLAQNAGLGYSYIASVGGTQGMGVRMGIEATYLTQGLPTDARLSKDEMRSGALMALANTTRSREAKNLATAYVAWRQNQGKNSDTSMAAFIKTLGGKPLTNDTLIAAGREALSQRFRGATADQLAAAYGILSQSEEVLDVQETENVGSVLLESKVDTLLDNRTKALTAFYNKNRAFLATKGINNASEFIRGVTGGDKFARTTIMHDNLNRMLQGDAGAYAVAGAMLKGLETEEQITLGTANTRQAQELMRKTEEGKSLRKQEVYYDTLSGDVRRVLTQARKSGGSIQSVIDTMYGANSEKGLEVATLTAAVMKVDSGALRKLNSNEELTKALDVVDSVGNKRGSALVGIRKTSGAPETAANGKKADLEYAVKRAEAEKAIANIAKNGGSDSDRAAIRAWADATALSDVQRAVYADLDKATATKLMTPKDKDDVFAEYTRLNAILESNAELKKSSGRTFIKTVRDAQETMRQARRDHGADVDAYLSLSPAERDKFRARKQNAAVVQMVDSVEKSIREIKGLNVKDQQELLKMVQSSGGSVEGMLGTIISLLSRLVANK